MEENRRYRRLSIYKTKVWFRYIELQGPEIFIVKIFEDDTHIGYFVGEKIKKIITIISSPFEGLGTGHQGLSMLYPISPNKRVEIYEHLANWIYSNGISWYLQIEDWQLKMEDMPPKTSFFYEPHRVKYVDLTQSEDCLYANLHKDCKYSIRKAQSNGIVIQDTKDVDTFIDVFFAQLEDVFDKKGLSPTRDKENVRKLLSSIWPNSVLLLEAKTQDGEIVATGIIPFHGAYSATWQTASFQKYQKLRPNELLRWEAMLQCKRRGAKMINFCGTQDWKDKFGPILTHTPRLIFCKYPILLSLKSFMKKLWYLKFTIKEKKYRRSINKKISISVSK